MFIFSDVDGDWTTSEIEFSISRSFSIEAAVVLPFSKRVMTSRRQINTLRCWYNRALMYVRVIRKV